MEKLVLVIHVLSALAIIVLILLQQGKGAAAGASFGAGASQTVFGSEGSGSFFTRATAIFAVVFFCTSFGLAVIVKNSSPLAEGIPSVLDIQNSQQTDVPVIETPASNSDVPAVQDEQ